VILFE
jgi:hypothetical protein